MAHLEQAWPNEPVPHRWSTIPVGQVVDSLRDSIEPDQHNRGPSVIAVDGRGGSGKSALTEALHRHWPGSVVLSTDDIAWHFSVFDWADWLAVNILMPLRVGRDVSVVPPGWRGNGRDGTVDVSAEASVVLLEGSGASRRGLVAHLDGALWVQADEPTCRRRLIARLGRERAVREMADWLPLEVPFFAEDRPWERATFVVNAGDDTAPPGCVAVGTTRSPRR